MVGVLAVYLSVFHICLVQRVVGGLICPDGITSFSRGVRSSSYYVCEEANGQPVIKKCARGKFYWASKKACYDIENVDNADQMEHTDLKISSRPVLGEPVFLGDFYNANTDAELTRYSFWNRDTILKTKEQKISPSSSVDIFATRSTIDNLQRTGFTTAIKLNVLGDLIRTKRSSAYLSDRLESENEVAVVLSYRATTHTETLSVSTPKDFDYCKVDGTTHVISSVTYGLGANFVFKKSVGGGDRDEVERDLKIAVDAVPTTTSDIPDSVNEIVKDIRVQFFSDFVSKKQPTSYQESVRMFQSLADRVGEFPKCLNTTVAKEIQLMPITSYCQGKTITYVAISNDILNSINEMLGEIEKTKLLLGTLKMEKVVRKYTPLMEILQTLSKGLSSFDLRMKTALEDILPRIRRGNTSEEALILLLNKYSKSPFYYHTIKKFLHNRRREVSSLDYILSPEKFKGTDIKILNYDEASDFQIMFIKPFVLMCKYNVLPSTLIARKFLNGETIDESKSWYNNPYVISAMGIAFNNFVQFSSVNANSKTHGFLLALSDAKDGVSNDLIDDIIVIDAQKEGLLYTFKFPKIPSKMDSTSNTHQSILFTVPRPASTWVTGFVISYWHNEKRDKIESRRFQFSKNNTTAAKVEELMANSLYGFTIQYITPMGLSPSSTVASFYTRPCSRPTNLKISILAADYFKMEWNVPLTCGKRVLIAKYRLIVTGDNNFSKIIVVDGVTNTEVKRLQPASYYTVSIEGIATMQTLNGTQKDVILTTLPSNINLITHPDAPSRLSLTNRSTHSVVVDWVAPSKVATGAIIEKYLVKYTKTDNLGNFTKRGTEMIVSTMNTTCWLTGLVQGTTYSVSVQVLTSKGDSDYSQNLLVTTMYVKSELDLMRDSINKVEVMHNNSIIAVESEIAKREEAVDSTIKSLSNIPSLMVFYPRLRSNQYLTDRASGCGGVINTAGQLWYPYNSYQYRYYEDCTWHINTGQPTALQFTYWGFNCNPWHYVMVHDEELLLKKAYTNPGTIHTRSGNVYIRFHSDAHCGTYYGFYITISVTDTKRMAAQRYYPNYKATFTGYGAPKSYSEHHTWTLPKSNDSIAACIEDCNKRYLTDHTWNKISIEMESDPLQCSCYKNPVGFLYTLSKFQYQMS